MNALDNRHSELKAVRAEIEKKIESEKESEQSSNLISVRSEVDRALTNNENIRKTAEKRIKDGVEKTRGGNGVPAAVIRREVNESLFLEDKTRKELNEKIAPLKLPFPLNSDDTPKWCNIDRHPVQRLVKRF